MLCARSRTRPSGRKRRWRSQLKQGILISQTFEESTPLGKSSVMPTADLHITLTRELADLVRDKVASGAFGSESEVIEAALELLCEQDAEAERQHAWLRDKVDRSLNDPRPPIPGDKVLGDLRRRHENNLKKR